MNKMNVPFLALDFILVVLSIFEFRNSSGLLTDILITYFLLLGVQASIIAVIQKLDRYFVYSHKIVIYSISIYMVISTIYAFAMLKILSLSVIILIQAVIIIAIMNELLKKLKTHGEIN